MSPSVGVIKMIWVIKSCFCFFLWKKVNLEFREKFLDCRWQWGTWPWGGDWGWGGVSILEGAGAWWPQQIRLMGPQRSARLLCLNKTTHLAWDRVLITCDVRSQLSHDPPYSWGISQMGSRRSFIWIKTRKVISGREQLTCTSFLVFTGLITQRLFM